MRHSKRVRVALRRRNLGTDNTATKNTRTLPEREWESGLYSQTSPKLHNTYYAYDEPSRKKKNKDLKDDLTRIVKALVISRIMYATPYLRLTQSKRQVDRVIRKAWRAALGLHMYTSNEILFALGLHYNFTEYVDAHLPINKKRLMLTRTRRAVLGSLSTHLLASSRNRKHLPKYITDKLVVTTITKRMNPKPHKEKKKSASFHHQTYLQQTRRNVLHRRGNISKQKGRRGSCSESPHGNSRQGFRKLVR